AFLDSDSRLGKWYRYFHFSKKHLKRHFVHEGRAGPGEERLWGVATWLFQRPRPYRQTDAAALCGFLDPPREPSVGSLAEEVEQLAGHLRRGVLLLSSEPPDGGKPPLLEAELTSRSTTHGVEC
ncbi:unnamed protein product, partial [Polarella glacialis]